jgi:hypothetical protein
MIQGYWQPSGNYLLFAKSPIPCEELARIAQFLPTPYNTFSEGCQYPLTQTCQRVANKYVQEVSPI